MADEPYLHKFDELKQKYALGSMTSEAYNKSLAELKQECSLHESHCDNARITLLVILAEENLNGVDSDEIIKEDVYKLAQTEPKPQRRRKLCQTNTSS